MSTGTRTRALEKSEENSIQLSAKATPGAGTFCTIQASQASGCIDLVVPHLALRLASIRLATHWASAENGAIRFRFYNEGLRPL